MAAVVNVYPRETVEFQEIGVTVEGLPVTVFDVAVARAGTRPTAWAPAIEVGGKTGFIIDKLPVGQYAVWVRYTANPETPVIEAGAFYVS